LPKDLGAIGVIRGDVLDLEAVDATVGGCDVVFSALGSRGLGATTLYSRGMANIITAMKANSVTRLLAITSAGVEDDPNMNFFARRFVMPVILRNVLADMRVMESEIEASGLVWTIVRPGRLTDGPRTDVADFMHRVVADERTIRKIAALTY
jgi:putative NADH-flavin reductase